MIFWKIFLSKSIQFLIQNYWIGGKKNIKVLFHYEQSPLSTMYGSGNQTSNFKVKIVQVHNSWVIHVSLSYDWKKKKLGNKIHWYWLVLDKNISPPFCSSLGIIIFPSLYHIFKYFLFLRRECISRGRMGLNITLALVLFIFILIHLVPIF